MKWIFWCAVFFHFAVAQAEVFKCVTPKGTIYQDEPCAAGKQSTVETRGTVVQLRTESYYQPPPQYSPGPQVVVLPNSSMSTAPMFLGRDVAPSTTYSYPYPYVPYTWNFGWGPAFRDHSHSHPGQLPAHVPGRVMGSHK